MAWFNKSASDPSAVAGSPPPDPCAVLMATFAPSAVSDPDGIHDALDKTIADQLWAQRVDHSGSPFASFPDFALHRRPNGLGVSTTRVARLLKTLLLDIEQISVWVEVLVRIARRPGHPIRTNGEGFRPFYTVSRGPHTVDRILLRLHSEKQTETLDTVCRGEISAHEAALRLGWVKPPPPADSTIYDAAAHQFDPGFIEGITGKAKTSLLGQLLDSMSEEERIDFLHLRLEDETPEVQELVLARLTDPEELNLDALRIEPEVSQPDASPP